MREAAIKHALAGHLVGSSGGGRVPLLEEVELVGGLVRADLVSVLDMHCYEIKSEGDKLVRLVSQGSRYARVFDRVTLVTAERHLEQALTMLPSWWGVLVVPSEVGGAFRQVRIAKQNKSQDSRVLVTLLKKEECLKVIGDIHGSTRGWKSKSLYILHEYLASFLSLEELKRSIRKHLVLRVQGGVN